MKKIILIILLFVVKNTHAQDLKTVEISINPLINGTLFEPSQKTSQTPLVIVIAGSGPTDRNGNAPGMTNNSLKYVAQELAKNKIACFSFDKRIIAQMKNGTVNEKELSFDTFVADTKDVCQYFIQQKKYSKIILAGHSEGALIGMLAAPKLAQAYISIAGAGRTIDDIIVEQIDKQAPSMKNEVRQCLDILKQGKTFELKNQMLASLFKESVQPYMISWIKYNPQHEIKKLNIPTLIINGTKDIQVNSTDANLLKASKPDAQLAIIDNMNHIFRHIKGDDAENIASYSNSDLPIDTELAKTIITFINKL